MIVPKQLDPAPALHTFTPLAALKVALAGRPLVTDYRYGAFFITHANGVENWRDETGLAKLTAPAGSKLARVLEQPAKLQFVEASLAQVTEFIENEHGLKFDLANLSPQDAHRPITANLEGHSLRNAIAILFADLRLRSELQGDTIVLKKQP